GESRRDEKAWPESRRQTGISTSRDLSPQAVCCPRRSRVQSQQPYTSSPLNRSCSHAPAACREHLAQVPAGGLAVADDCHQCRQPGVGHVLGQPGENLQVVLTWQRRAAVWVTVPLADVLKLAAACFEKLVYLLQ